MIFDSKFRVERFPDRDSTRVWKELLEKSPGGDIYLTPDYILSTNLLDKGEVFVASQIVDDQHFVIYPFYRREIKLQTPNSIKAEKYYDLTTPYGYSGPLLSPSDDLNTRFFKNFTEWCKENNVVTEFIRYNPFLENHRVTSGFTRTEICSQIVHVDLARPLLEIVAGFSSQHRRNLKNAQKNGLMFRRVEPDSWLETFITLYYQTMRKVEAREFYFFSKEYFCQQRKLLNSDFHLFTVCHQDDPVAMAICLSYKNRLHYHLGASDDRFLMLRPNNILFFGIIRWAQERGYDTFNLGGGLCMHDSLFNFKYGFSKNVLNFYCGKTIYNHPMYEVLNETHRKVTLRSRQKFYSETYFPLYRS